MRERIPRGFASRALAAAAFLRRLFSACLFPAADAWVLGSVLLGLPTNFVLKRDLLKVPIAGALCFFSSLLFSPRGGEGVAEYVFPCALVLLSGGHV